MPNKLCILHMLLLILAFFSSLLVSIPSTPNPNSSIARSRFNKAVQLNGKDISELMLGTWAPCSNSNCSKAAFGYVVRLSDTAGNRTVVIASKSTRTLVVHPAVTGAIVLTFFLTIVFSDVFYLSPRMNRFNLAVSLLAPILALIALVIDIVFLASVRSELRGLKVAVNTKAGPGFWMLLACLILLAGTPFVAWWRLPSIPPPKSDSEWEHSAPEKYNLCRKCKGCQLRACKGCERCDGCKSSKGCNGYKSCDECDGKGCKVCDEKRVITVPAPLFKSLAKK